MANAKKIITDAQTAGTLLNLENKTAEYSFQTGLVLNELGAQPKTNPTAINESLVVRYNTIKDGTLSVDAQGNAYDIEGISALIESDVKINFNAIKVSEDGKWIAVEGDFMTLAAFKVAKGKGEYVGTYNITILVKDAPELPGSAKANKAAKIVVTADEADKLVTTLEEVK